MTVSSIGSTFSYIPAPMAIATSAPKERIAEVAEASASTNGDQSSTGSDSDFPAQTASEKLEKAASKLAPSLLVRLQAQASDQPTASSGEATRAYSR